MSTKTVRSPKKRSGKIAEWDNILKSLPNNILFEEQKRRLALKNNVSKIPEALLDAEISRREEEIKNRPLQWID